MRYLFSGIQIVSKYDDRGRSYWTAPVDANGNNTAVTPTFWDAATAGTQYADFTTDQAGTTATTPTQPAGGITVGDFYGPDGVTSMWLDDGNGPRVQVFAAQPNATADTQVAALVPASSGSATSAALSAAYANRLVVSDPATGNHLTKYGVVIDLGASGQFDNWRVEGLTTLFDPVSGRIAGVYVGYSDDGTTQRGTIGLAWSDDGVTWTKAGQFLAQSGVAGAPDENGCSGPVLLYDGTTYHLFYIGLTATGYEGGTKTLCHATTPSLTSPTWTRHGAVLSPGGGGWRNVAVYHPSFVHVGGTWYCFINCAGADGRETIGYATATTLDGPWTFQDANSPLVQPQNGWTIAGDPSVTKIPGGWRMDFYQFDGGNFAADYYAVTSDEAFPLGWTVANGGNPVLQPSEAYDGLFAHKPFIMRLGGRLFHYYTAVTTGSQRRTCALATTPGVRASMLGAGPVHAINQTAWLSGFVDSLEPFGYPVDDVVPSGVLVKDTFARGKSFGTANTGQAWTVALGTVTQERGIVHAASLGASVAEGQTADIVIDAGRANVTVDCDLKAAMPGVGEWVEVYLRYADASNYFSIRVDQSQKTTIIKVVAGALSVPANNTATPWSAGDHITVKDDGTNITVYQNGTQVVTAADTTGNTATKVGFRWGSQTATEMDNFTVTATA